jgi:hypothetical protein
MLDPRCGHVSRTGILVVVQLRHSPPAFPYHSLRSPSERDARAAYATREMGVRGLGCEAGICDS